MRLVRLSVEHFGCVQRADVEFGNQLNVLYGPNDLGKSSLAAAIRAVLLLQPGSSAHEPYVSWQSGDAPEVVLTVETERHHYWRVHKRFGNKAVSTLHFSSNGRDFHCEFKGRQVDSELRKQLGWGIPEPGGRGGPRGFPTSFLTAALLAEQGEVADLFDRKLADDPDPSGKKLLADVLQATARDPLFGSIVKATQSKVDDAFTPTGKRSRARTSPFYGVAQELKKTASELDQLEIEAQKNRHIDQQITALNQQLLNQEAARERARQTLAGIEAMVAKQSELDRVRGELGRAEELIRQSEEAQRAQQEQFERSDQLKAHRDRCQEELDQARTALTRAEERIEQLRRDQREQEHRIRQCDLDRAELEHRRRDADDRAELARQVDTAGREHDRIAAELAALDTELADRQGQLADHRTTLEQLQAERDLLQAVDKWLRWRDLRDQLDKADQAAIELVQLFTEIEELSTKADELAEEIEVEVAAQPLPSAGEMARLRDIDGQLRVARAALDVGISVTIEPVNSVRVEVACDGEETVDLGDIREPRTVAAGREMRLTLPNLATMRVAGGSGDANSRYRAAVDSWAESAEPILSAAGVSSLDQLDRLFEQASERVGEIEELRRQVELLEEQAESKRQALIAVQPLRHRANALEDELSAHDLDQLDARVAELGESAASAVGDRIAAVQRDLDAAEKHTLHLQLDLAAQTQRRASTGETLERALERREKADRAIARLAASESSGVGPDALPSWQTVLQDAEEAMVDCERRLAELDEQRRALVEGASDAAARAELEAARERAIEAEKALHHAVAELEKARDELSRRNYDAETKIQAVETIEVEPLRARVNALAGELDELRAAHGGDGAAVASEADLENARALVGRAGAEVREVEKQLDQARGALRETGGERLREKLDDLHARHRQLQHKEQDVELDYRAWKLLLDALLEAEKEQAVHLGRSMAGPVADRFRELTSDRYGGLDLGPDLETHGIFAGGGQRRISVLSVGTKEQLSTIFRLSLAERLGSAVLLDDQLTQTDPRRMDWFRRKLREISQHIQIIVLTCRAGDYLIDDELPRDRAKLKEGAGVRAIQLENVISRT
ncbi:MAG: hypothetical protein MJE77_16705 [Proteobacteria bacterium]|nr:hypothetical protein [Pseudomonadota bacterium]